MHQGQVGASTNKKLLQKYYKIITKLLTFFAKYNILIKNLVAKLYQDGRQYIRLAVKTTEENDKLIASLKKIFIS